MKLTGIGKFTSGGLANSVMNSHAGKMAESISFHKAPKTSLNPSAQKRSQAFRRYNPIKVAIHARGSKKAPKGFKGMVQTATTGSVNTKTPGTSGIAFGGE